jgi:hypothetical protein
MHRGNVGGHTQRKQALHHLVMVEATALMISLAGAQGCQDV